MIANVNPSHACFDESHNTLKYANRAKNIKIRPKLHIMTAEMTYQQRIEKLEKENVALRTALAQAHVEIAQASPAKRKSESDTDISPMTLKKFKNMSWAGDSDSATGGGSTQPVAEPDPLIQELQVRVCGGVSASERDEVQSWS